MSSVRIAAFLRPIESDSQLLAWFHTDRDEAAFTELVRRHGSAVFAICRRLTRHQQDAEDAFQATFLVLARKANQLRPTDPIGGWLVGVASRTARKAASRTWRRRDREGYLPEDHVVADSPGEPFDADAAQAVLEAVARLPGWLREPVVLCELEGRSRSAVARSLKIPEGTLSSRLATARKRLADRLMAKGYGPAALAILAPIAVPPHLQAATSALLSGTVPATVASLAHGVMRTMVQFPWKIAPLMSAGLFASAVVFGTNPLPAEGKAPATRPIVAAQPAAAKPAADSGKIYFCCEAGLHVISPKGGNADQLNNDPQLQHLDFFSVSPNGKKVAYAIPERRKDESVVTTVTLQNIDGKGQPTKLIEVPFVRQMVWAPDSSAVAITRFDGPFGSINGSKHYLLEPGKEPALLKIPGDHVIAEWSADGKQFLTVRVPRGQNKIEYWLTPVQGGAGRRVAELETQGLDGKLSPDGKQIITAIGRLTETPAEKARREKVGDLPSFRDFDLISIDVATGKATPFPGYPANTVGIPGYCWSPDGKRLVYSYVSAAVGGEEEKFRMIVCDADGGNKKTILEIPGSNSREIANHGYSWR